jgi:hypothetical protein
VARLFSIVALVLKPTVSALVVATVIIPTIAAATRSSKSVTPERFFKEWLL